MGLWKGNHLIWVFSVYIELAGLLDGNHAVRSSHDALTRAP
jgi:hypothetical protein